MVQESKSKTKIKKLAGATEFLLSRTILGIFPLIAVLSSGKSNPLLFFALWSSGTAVAVFLNLRYFSEFEFTKKKFKYALRFFLNRRKDNRVSFPFDFIDARTVLLFIHLEALILVWSFRYVNEFVGTIIIASPTMLFTIFTGRINKSNKVTKQDLMVILVVFLSIILIVVTNISTLSDLSTLYIGFIFGIAILLLSIPLHLQDWLNGLDLDAAIYFEDYTIVKNYEQIENKLSKDESEKHLESVLFMLTMITSAGFGFILLAVVTLTGTFKNFTNALSFWQILLILFGSIIVYSNVPLLSGGHFCKPVNTFGAFSPAVSVGLLTLLFPLRDTLSSIGVEVPASSEIVWPWLVIVLLGIIAAEMFMMSLYVFHEGESNAKKNNIFGLPFFVMILWLAGALTYLRDEWGWWVSQISALETDALEYYAFLGVSTAILAVLVAFEITRLEQRLEKEHDTAFWLLSRLEQLEYRPRTDKKRALEYLTQLDSVEERKASMEEIKEERKKLLANDQEAMEQIFAGEDKAGEDKHDIKNPYTELRKIISSSGASTDPEISRKLNSFAFGKQHGTTLSSKIAIIILALFSIILSLALRPSNDQSLQAVFIDSSSLILPAAMAHLVFHLLDLGNTRLYSSIMQGSSPYEYIPDLSISETKEAKSVMVFLVFLIIATYATLYSIKWLA